MKKTIIKFYEHTTHPRFTREQVLRMLVVLYWQFNSEDSDFSEDRTQWGTACRDEKGLTLPSLGCRYIDKIIKLIATERQYNEYHGCGAQEISALLLPDGAALDGHGWKFQSDADVPAVTDCDGEKDYIPWAPSENDKWTWTGEWQESVERDCNGESDPVTLTY